MPDSGFPPIPKGYTWRPSLKGKHVARSTYDPDWSPTCPWSVVYMGEVKSYRGSLQAAQMELRNRYNCY
jgi:hypothetical protein